MLSNVHTIIDVDIYIYIYMYNNNNSIYLLNHV